MALPKKSQKYFVHVFLLVLQLGCQPAARTSSTLAALDMLMGEKKITYMPI